MTRPCPAMHLLASGLDELLEFARVARNGLDDLMLADEVEQGLDEQPQEDHCAFAARRVGACHYHDPARTSIGSRSS